MNGAVYLTMLRPTQWLKNLMLFFPPFLAGQALHSELLSKGVLPFIAFCLVSSSGYIFNDLMDRERDQHHPQKRMRPIPSGAVSACSAGVMAAALAACGLLMALSVSSATAGWLLLYLAVSAAYSFKLKNLPIIDLVCIASGFLIRLQAGSLVFQVPLSHWLFVTVFLLAIFLSAGKRLAEIRSMKDTATEHRRSLAGYPRGFLLATLYVTGTTVLITYALYTLQKPKLIYSVPLCALGLLRYLLRVNAGKSGDPTESLLKDPILFVISIVWVAMVIWSIYL